MGPWIALALGPPCFQAAELLRDAQHPVMRKYPLPEPSNEKRGAGATEAPASQGLSWFVSSSANPTPTLSECLHNLVHNPTTPQAADRGRAVHADGDEGSTNRGDSIGLLLTQSLLASQRVLLHVRKTGARIGNSDLPNPENRPAAETFAAVRTVRKFFAEGHSTIEV